MPKKIYREIPENYPVCLHADCPRAATCLHRIAYTPQLEKAEYLRLINPGRCTPDGQCPYYRDSAPVTYARGFTNFQSRMYPAQYKKFMNTLVQAFGRNSYFERRRGDTALSPKEQSLVLQALRKAGVTDAPPFDHYEENTNWYDQPSTFPSVLQYFLRKYSSIPQEVLRYSGGEEKDVMVKVVVNLINRNNYE